MKTPYTEKSLKRYDHYNPGQAAYLAWNTPGANPRWHRKMQKLVRKQMPLLARALDRM